jgi:hypothetical protein
MALSQELREDTGYIERPMKEVLLVPPCSINPIDGRETLFGLDKANSVSFSFELAYM